MQEHSTNHGIPKRFCFVLLTVLFSLILIDRVAPFVLPRSAYLFRALEHMTGGYRYNIPRRGKSFTMLGYGDLANMLGVSRFRAERELTFTLDQQGHRNEPLTQHADPDILVIGNSFITGAGNTDAATFTSQLQRRTSRKVSAYAPANMSTFLREDSSSPDVVIWGRVERNLLGFDGEIQKLLLDTSCFQEISERERRTKRAKDIVKNAIGGSMEYAQLSILRRTFQRLYQEIHFHFTGTPPRNVIIGKDQKSLFFIKGVRIRGHSARDRKMADVIDAVKHVRDCLAERGIDFIFLPIPDKENVYADAVTDNIAWVLPEPLDVLHDELRKHGITVVPLLFAFRSAKERGEALYWSDDTHWNPEGVAVAVEESIGALMILDQLYK